MVHGFFDQARRLTVLALLAFALGCGGAEQSADKAQPEVPTPHPELNQPTANPEEMGDPGKDGSKPKNDAEVPSPAAQTPLAAPTTE